MIELISEIKQKNNGVFPLVDANNIRGGTYSVISLQNRDNIPTARRKQGMICYVQEVDKYFKLESTGAWTEWTVRANGIPIYDQELLDKATQLPDKYITIANKETDLNNQPYSREIKQSGTYVDILFSAIRKLQSEVAKLRNSFQYGMYSYTENNTAMSRQLEGISDPDAEPLWCVEEDDLSLVYSMSIGLGHDLTPTEEVNVNTEGILKINNATWHCNNTDVEDPKLFLYLTTTGLNIEVNLINDYSFNLSTLGVPKADVYNTMICINRNNSNSYIYISIGAGTQVLKEGYLYNGQLYTTPRYINDKYYFLTVVFNNLDLSKLNLYSKYQDFSSQVIPSAPTDEDYKYKVAHLTIRSVSTKSVLDSIKNQLPENELIFVANERKLYVKHDNNLISIGSNSSPIEEGMTKEEMFKELINMGLIKNSGTEQSPVYELNDFADISLVNEDTGKVFKIDVDSNGNIRSNLIPDKVTLLDNRVNQSQVELKQNVRGFIGQLRIAEANKAGLDLKISGDAGLYADRVKIGAFYAPLSTDKVHGCNRAFIELENTSDSDFQLTGCYLHLTKPNADNQQTVYHLPLTGVLKAGSTYLIVGKEYVPIDDANVIIKVQSFDQEWFVNKQLIDLSIDPDTELGYGLALTYGNENLQATDYLYKVSDSTLLNQIDSSLVKSSFPKVYDPSFIDAVYYYKGVLNASTQGYWSSLVLKITSNTMYKNMFELDPAKQAFQSCNKKDSSRARWENLNDVWIMDLSKPTVKFEHSNTEYPLTKFSPKASFEHKNVSTDKSKLDTTKPNMVTCSFGINIHTTRCFNWISVGYHDEYVYLRKQGTEDWIKFESYKESSDTLSESFPRRKVYKDTTKAAIYNRIIGRFPGDGTFYTAHKCVIELTAVDTPEVWEYKVGRDDSMSDIQTFTLYPTSYKPVIYHITDQQGFHWIEYQVWAAAANKLYEKIKADQKLANIIPILINTGDMTQNGTRINEWYDYYQAGKILFKEFEQNNVVGNNDLCGTNIEELGTGDDNGKSNSFYFHVFYCYDVVDDEYVPIINNKYVPSLYYFESDQFRFIMINSEITYINCQKWFNLTKGEDIVNIYTGFTLGATQTYDNSFKSIYSMVYNMLNTDKQCIAVCHEMPYTVITNSSITNGQEGFSRSVGPGGGALIGSHCNQITNTESGKGLYWLSRLLEYKKVKLCIGGHKHTYACTYPVREYFLFGDGKNSKDNYNEYSMEPTLENDNVTWVQGSKHLTKFPLTKRADVGEPTGSIFFPYTAVPELEGGVTYFMCQATGYKLTSNKELPSANQKFSLVVPNTTIKGGKDTASSEQKYPMFGIINLDTYDIKLVRVANIFKEFKFAQNVYSTEPMKLQYFKQVPDNNYGQWVNDETIMLTL